MILPHISVIEYWLNIDAIIIAEDTRLMPLDRYFQEYIASCQSFRYAIDIIGLLYG